MLFCIIFILSACTQSEEDIHEYSGIINDGKAMGYEYTVIKEENLFSWNIGYKNNIATIEESLDNQDALQNFMMAVNDSQLKLTTLTISLSYFLIVVVISFYLYKKHNKLFKDGAIAIVLVSSFALYIAGDAAIQLHLELQDVKIHYLSLTN